MLAMIGAMDEEVELLRADMEISEEATHAEILVTRGRFRDTEIALVHRII